MAGWQGSTRRATLPPDWYKLRQAVKARDKGKCRCPGCPKCVGGPCITPGTDCDHIGSRTNHALTNLRLLCGACHLHRTGRQGGTAPRKARPTGKRPPEQHPGVL